MSRYQTHSEHRAKVTFIIILYRQNLIFFTFQAVQSIFELPLDFQNETMLNKLSNWDLAADIVNVTSKVRRSGRQCRDRYQNVLLPREEGKVRFQEI